MFPVHLTYKLPAFLCLTVVVYSVNFVVDQKIMHFQGERNHVAEVVLALLLSCVLMFLFPKNTTRKTLA
jgi:uncharacterized membrane protein YraQ (UPF0718 family)